MRADIDDGTMLFVKKLRDDKAVGDDWLDQQSKTLFPHLRNMRPETIWNQDGWYVSEYLSRFTTLKATRNRKLLGLEARTIGSFLAQLHSAHFREPDGLSAGGADPQQGVRPMRALSIADYSDMPGLDRDIYIRVCQRADEGLEKLSGALAKICAVHGDFQGNNILLETSGGGGLRVIDWENAGMGDPAWDLGHLLASLIQRWVDPLKLDSVSVADAFAAGQEAWVQLADWFAEVLASYRDSVNVHIFGHLDIECLFQVAGHAMVQRARNILNVYGRFSPKDILMLSMAERLITSPSQSIIALTPSLAEWKKR